ncbi:EAL domain-containing protein (putative c-di-GMP-specific phosphodiesterase class I) [Arthrobacter sp. GAS37]
MRKLNGSSARRHPKGLLRASADDVKRGLLSPAGLWLLVVACADAAFALSIRLPMVFGHEPCEGFDGPAVVPALGAVLLVPVVLHAAWRLLREQHDERAQAGIGRPADGRAAGSPAADEVRARVEGVLTDRTLMTAFQPIRCLGTGSVIGAEALTRFVTSPVRSPETWFADAASIGRGPDLEFLAMETALLAAAKLPADLYIAINLSPAACLDSRLGEILQRSGVPAGRVVVEVTERSAVADYEPLAAALVRLRHSGLRVAVDDAGAGFASMRHILQLRPELIKLDRTIIAGIDTEPGQRVLGMAMVSFATGIGAALIAEGIETDTELTTVTELGMNVGQGYLLGRPSVRSEDWAQWHNWSDGRANVQDT